MDDLVRVGKKGDGGYVIPECCINRTTTLLSFGISDDWTFEEDFMKYRKDITLYAYDYSVSTIFFVKNIVQSFLGFKVEKTVTNICKALTFRQFFNPAKRRFFIRKYVGTIDTEQYVSVPTIFKSEYGMHNAQELSVFVKMDIEDNEYKVLPLFKPWYSLINGFVIEFHRLDICSAIFNSIIEELQTSFYISHVHANNWDEWIDRNLLPPSLEITFVNKSLFSVSPAYSKKSYPIDDLDYPCNPKKPDIPLVFHG